MIKKVCNALSLVVLVVLLGLAAVFLLPMALGYKELAVLSGSMTPNIPVGSIVYVKPMDAGQLVPGDVCTYLLPDGETYVTHRVVSIDAAAGTLVTQGDANDTPDGEINFAQVVGKAQFHLPALGYISIYARTPTGILVVTGGIVVIILLNFIPAILDTDDDDPAPKKPRHAKR